MSNAFWFVDWKRVDGEIDESEDEEILQTTSHVWSSMQGSQIT